MKLFFLKIILFALFCSPNLFANDYYPVAGRDDLSLVQGWNFGLGLVYRDSYYAGESARFLPIPLVSYRTKNLSVGTTEIRYEFLRLHALINMAALIKPEYLSGYEAEDSEVLAGMDERKTSLNFELRTRMKLYPIGLGLFVTREILGLHRGTTASLRIGTGFPFLGKSLSDLIPGFPKSKLTFRYFLKFYNDSYVNYYFGVKPSEATLLRRAYATDALFTNGFSVSTRIRLSSHWRLRSSYFVEFLSRRLRRSPIVGTSAVNKVYLEFDYLF